MSWVTIDEDDLMASMTARERDLFGTSVTDDADGAPSGPADRVTPILADLVAEVRGAIASHTGNTLSEDTTKIPQSFRAQALAIGRFRVLITIPHYQPGEARSEEYRNAVRFFERVAEGKIRPEPADDATPSTVPARNSAEVLDSVPDSRTGRTRMDGL